MTARVWVDQGNTDCPALGLCWCGVRFLRLDRAGAWSALASHEADQHPGVQLARPAARTLRRRQLQKTGR